MYRRNVFIALCLLAATGAIVPGSGRAAGPKLGAYYVAIGDSFSLGYLAPGLPVDSQCRTAGAPGFVCIFYRYLKRINPHLGIQNFSQAGAQSCVLVQGHQCNESAPTKNPLEPALGFINAHQGEVSPITVTIGGNDVLQLLPRGVSNLPAAAQQVPAVVALYRSNLDAILSRLRSSAPDAQIIVTTQPNVIGGIKSPPFPQGLPEMYAGAISALNGAMKTEAPRYNAAIADSAQSFDAHPGGAASLTYVPASLAAGNGAPSNPHPTAAGYRVYAQRVIADSGYTLPLTLSFHVERKRAWRGERQRVVGSTTPGATVTATVALPGDKHRRARAIAAGSGAYSLTFSVGARAGSASVRVCTADATDATLCRARIKFMIR